MSQNSDANLVLTEIDSGIATVTLNRPDALNALSANLRNEISETFEKLSDNKDVGAIVLTGAGRAFTVGLDLKELGGEKPSSTPPHSKNLLDIMSAVPQPIIGAINGYAITGGFELALMCDFLIASPDAKFADTHARVGVVPGWGLSQRLPRLIGINRAKELSLTGNFLSAEQALAWGLVNRVVPGPELLAVCLSLAADILSTDAATCAEIKRIMDAGWHDSLSSGLQMERRASKAHDRSQAPSSKVAGRRADIQKRGRAQSS